MTSSHKHLPRTLSTVPYVFDFLMPLSNVEKKHNKQLAQRLAVGTNFGEEEVRLLLLMMWYVSPTKCSFDRGLFRQMMHGIFKLTDDIILDRLFRMFDRDNDGLINQEEWILGQSTFLESTGEDRSKWAFHIYDLNNDGFIAREEVFHLLKNSMIKLPNDEERDESIKDLVEMVNKKLDVDKDGRISLDDFIESVKQDKLVLQSFGRCLPKPEAIRTFRGILEQFRGQL